MVRAGGRSFHRLVIVWELRLVCAEIPIQTIGDASNHPFLECRITEVSVVFGIRHIAKFEKAGRHIAPVVSGHIIPFMDPAIHHAGLQTVLGQ